MKKLWQELINMVRNGLLHIFSGNILTKAIAMISGVAVARIADKAEYAYYSYANNLYAYIEILAGLGLASAMLKYCSSEGDHLQNKAYFSLALRSGSLFQIFASVILCAGVALVTIPFPSARKYIYAMILLPALSYALTTIQTYCRTHLRYKLYSGLGVLQTAIVCVLGILLVWVVSVWGMIAARYIAVVLVIGIGLFCMRDVLGGETAPALDWGTKKAFYSMGISLMIANVFSNLMPINEAFLINNLIRDEVVTANFRVAGLFPEQLRLITGSIVVYYFPIASRISDRTEFWKKAKRIAFLNGVIIIPVIIAGVALTPFFISLLYGQKYVDAIPLTYMLWLMRAANVLIRMIPMNFLPALGHTRFNAICAAVSCVVQVILDYVLILYMGIQGVAYAALAVYLASGFATWGYLYYVCMKKEPY